MHKLLIIVLTLALLGISGGAAPAFADTRYISDRLTVPLRSGPTNGHRILHRGLPAGTQLEVLEKDGDSNYVRIRTARGTEGWLESQYLDTQPIARQRLSTAESEIRQLRESLEAERARALALRSDKGTAEAVKADLEAQVTVLSTELRELKKISSNAVAEHSENQRLGAMNQRLRIEVQGLAEQRDRLEDRSEQQVLLYGAGLVLMGLLVGLLVKARPRRSAWS